MIAFDNFPVVYFTIGYLLAVVIVLLALPNKIKKQELLFLLASGLLLTVMRLPILVFNQEINADESQMIAHALTLRQFPVYWQSVDGTTIGPLDNYLLLLPSFFGLPFDYTSARLMGLLCVLGSLLFFYLSLKNFFDKTTARLGLLPALLLLAFTQDPDFVHYSSEQLPVFLLNVALWLLSKYAIEGGSRSNWIVLVLGIVLGISPFAKIQVVPQAAVIGLFLLIFVYKSPRYLYKWGILIAGGLLFPLLTIIWGSIYGVLGDFWNFYILGNLIYAGGSSLWDSVIRIPSFFSKSTDFLLFLIGIGLVILLGLGNNFRKSLNFLKVTSFAALWLLASLYAATKSSNDFVHYLNFCIYPFALLGALFISKTTHQSKLIYLSASLVFLPFGISFVYKVLINQSLNAYISTATHGLQQSDVTKLILKHAQPGERLVVWGWMCKYHAETQMPQGAAEAHFERCIFSHPMREKYYQGFLEDLKTNQPKVFVDAVGPNSLWLNDPTTQAHEVFPEARDFIEKNYVFVGKTENTRVYIRK